MSRELRPQTAIQNIRISKATSQGQVRRIEDNRPTTAIYGQQFHITNEPVKERKTILKDIVKKKPQHEKIEEERLTQEQLQLNNQLKEVLQERINLQERLQIVESQREKYQNLIYEIEDFVNKKKGMKIGQGESWLVIKLKNQINELNNKIEEREDYILELKKNPHYTKRQEMQIMIEYLNYFSQKLKQHANEKENTMRGESQKNETNTIQINKLEREIQEMEVTYQQLLDQNENLQIQKSIWDKKVSQQYLILDKTKQDLKDKEKDIYYLKCEIKKIEECTKVSDPNKKNIVTIMKDSTFKQNDLDKQKNQMDIEDKKAEIYDKEQIIQQQEKIINELKERLQERTNQEIKSKNQLHDELSEIREQVQQMKSQFLELKNYYYNEIQPLETENLPVIQGNQDHVFTILHDILNKQEKTFVKVPRVMWEEVENLGKEISMRLQLRQIPLEEALSLIISEKSAQRKTATVDELQEILQKDPFQIADPQQAMLLARFMVEDNSQDMVNLDPESSQRVPVIKSVFRKLTGCYQLMDSSKDRKLWDEISHFIVKFESGLKNQFDNIPTSRSGFIQTKDLFHAFSELFIELTEQQKEYILLRLFAYTNNIHKIMHMKLFDIFKPGSWIDRFNIERRK